jgi:hypothetical protein
MPAGRVAGRTSDHSEVRPGDVPDPTRLSADQAEEKARAADIRRQEKGPRDAPEPPATSGSYIRCQRHPVHGEAVMYLPGELLPEWVRQRLQEARPDAVDPRVLVLS